MKRKGSRKSSSKKKSGNVTAYRSGKSYKSTKTCKTVKKASVKKVVAKPKRC